MESETALQEKVHWLLWNGVAAGSAVLLFGAALSLLSGDEGRIGQLAAPIAMAGIGIILLTPIARVALMLLHYLENSDSVYALICAFILAAALAGFLAGN